MSMEPLIRGSSAVLINQAPWGADVTIRPICDRTVANVQNCVLFRIVYLIKRKHLSNTIALCDSWAKEWATIQSKAHHRRKNRDILSNWGAICGGRRWVYWDVPVVGGLRDGL